MRVLVFFAALLAALLGLTSPARAHQVGLSRGEYAVSDGVRFSMTLALSRRELGSLEVDADADHDGAITVAELSASRPLVTARLPPLVSIRRGSGDCLVTLTDLVPDADDGFAAHLEAGECGEGRSAPFLIDLSPLLSKLEQGHRHAAFLRHGDGTTTEALLFRGAATLTVAVASGVPAPERPERASVAWQYLELGVEHILGGLDHVVFLLGLLLVGSRLRHLALMVTAFTVAHSVTLGLAVLGILAPSPAYIEPLIALSVAYVGVENFVVKDAAKRWRITAIFGLIHGFGFAGALGEVGVPTTSVPLALAAFNVGVELGQLALIAVALPVFALLRRVRWVDRHGVRVASAGIVAAGVFWFVVRVLPAS